MYTCVCVCVCVCVCIYIYIICAYMHVYTCPTDPPRIFPGPGSGLMGDEEELRQMARVALASAPQLLVEQSLKGWKEVEYEVTRFLGLRG